MRKFFLPLLITVFLIGAPMAAQAAESTFFGPLISAECNCPTGAPGWGCILESIRLIMNFGVSIAIVIVVLILAYGGFLLMMNPTNPENRKTARTVLMNAVIGFLIVISAWLMVDFVMKHFYNSGSFGPWNSILSGVPGSMCIEVNQGIKPLGGLVQTVGDLIVNQKPSTNILAGGGVFTFDPGIASQLGDASPQLSNTLSCMASKLPSGVGRVSSISDSLITSGQRTFAQCAIGGCAHTAHSCHYGGTSCVGKSYAVDFGDDQNMSTLTSAAQACGAKTLNEGNHLHVSVGAAAGCGCSL